MYAAVRRHLAPPVEENYADSATILARSTRSRLAFREIVDVSSGHVYEAQISISAFSLSPSGT